MLKLRVFRQVFSSTSSKCTSGEQTVADIDGHVVKTSELPELAQAHLIPEKIISQPELP